MNGVIYLNLYFFLYVNCAKINFSVKIQSPQNEDNDTLQLVNVIFRHGNRTNSGAHELYPNNPYINYSYFPIGYGQLTNAGKVKTFKVGKTLRKRYNKFLGNIYYPEIVEAYSTEVDRTKMSLQLALAGLFPPTKDDAEATGLSWQPVPFNVVPQKVDKVLSGAYCAKYLELYSHYTSLPKYQSQIETYKETFDYISNHTGGSMKLIKDIYNLNLGLSTEEEYGLILPEWTKSIWPETIKKIAVEEYFVSVGLPEMKKMAIGYFIEKLLNDIKLKINDTRKYSRKIHIYASHESTIGSLLVGLGVFDKYVPAYGSHIIWELHKINGTYGIKMFQENWDGRGLRLLKILNCEEFCTLDKFESIVQEILPTPGLCD